MAEEDEGRKYSPHSNHITFLFRDGSMTDIVRRVLCYYEAFSFINGSQTGNVLILLMFGLLYI